tara:strand:- start:1468 stop:3153 length:1686 start_codon:yes stop_codon:yes gene_type:complete
MQELTQEIESLFEQSPHGCEWMKVLFWDLLDFDRIAMPVPLDVLPASARGGVQEATLWAECGDLRTIIIRHTSGDWTSDTLGQVAGTLALVWRRALMVFADSTETKWRLVICIPRSIGQAGECRVINLSNGCQNTRISEMLATLSPETTPSQSFALRNLWHFAEPLIDPTESIMLGLPRWLQSQLKDSSFEDFVRQAGSHTNLTGDEEARLGERIQDGDRDAWRELVRHNIRLAIWGARRFAKSQLEFDDLVQHSLLGVMRAADRFDPSKETRFSTYTFHWMRQHCQRACEVEGWLVRIPHHYHQNLREYRKRSLQMCLNGDTTNADPEYEHLLRMTSLDCFEWAKSVVYSEASHDDDPASIVLDEINAEDREKRIKEVLSKASERDREVVYRRFGLNGREESTLEDIGSELGITKERVRQIEIKQLALLRELLPKKYPDDFPNLDGEVKLHCKSTQVLSAKKQIMSLISQIGTGIPSIELSQALDVPRSIRKSAIRMLLDDGAILICGEGRSARYQLNSDLQHDGSNTNEEPNGTTAKDTTDCCVEIPGHTHPTNTPNSD